MTPHRTAARLLLAAGLGSTALSGLPALAATSGTAPDKAAIAQTYADIAAAGYADSHATAATLKARIDALIAQPSAETLHAAREAWLQARVPYQQTEAFRFGNPIVDEWEGKVNAWPLDEGLIDYTAGDYGNEENPLAAVNIIATPAFGAGGAQIDATIITPELLESLMEADDVEANVTTGYHAIEFLLWGQDLNGTNHGAGARPWTDYAGGTECTHGNCDRRGQYLAAAAALLVADLDWMAQQWAEGGEARAAVTADPEKAISIMFTGLGSLSYGELAGERMKLGLMLGDPEEEHDCFSDNTHNSHYYDGLGIRNVYLGEYVRVDGTVISGPSLSDLVAATAPEADAEVRADLDAAMKALGRIKTAAEAGLSYDQMLDPENEAGGALISAAVDALVTQTQGIQRAVAALTGGEIAFEGSDSLDNPSAVVQ